MVRLARYKGVDHGSLRATLIKIEVFRITRHRDIGCDVDLDLNEIFSVPLTEKLTSTISRIRTGTTYIHCAQGHGRTGLFALALLSTRGKVDSFEDGFSCIKNVRPGIGLNKTQETFIRKFIAEQRDADEFGKPRD